MTTSVQPIYDRLWSAIADIDEKLDSLDDSGTATKRRVINELIEGQKETWERVSGNALQQLSALEDDDAFTGVVEGLIAELRRQTKERIEKHVTAKVEAAPKVEAQVSAEEAAELSKQRSLFYQQIKMAVELASLEGETLEMPKTRRGSKGKRGVRAMSRMKWAINGEGLPEDTKFRDLSEQLGFETSKDFTAFLKSQGVDTTKPEGGKVKVTLKDGRILEGHIPDYVEELDTDDDDDDDDDDENGEETPDE